MIGRLVNKLQEKAVADAYKRTGTLWMQAIKDANGGMKRAFCLVCLSERKPWIGGEICEHFKDAEAVPELGEMRLEKPVSVEVELKE